MDAQITHIHIEIRPQFLPSFTFFSALYTCRSGTYVEDVSNRLMWSPTFSLERMENNTAEGDER